MAEQAPAALPPRRGTGQSAVRQFKGLSFKKGDKMKRRLLLASISVFAATQLAVATADAFQGAGASKCADCHVLTKEDAAKLLKADKLKIQVKDVRMSVVKGLWEIEISQGEKGGVIFMDFGKKLLVEGVRVSRLEQLGEVPPLPKVDIKKIPLDEAIVYGNPSAEKRIIVFDDPECPYCARLHDDLKKLLANRKDVVVYVKLFPLKIHPDAYEKSRSVVCAKSAKLLDDAFAQKPVPKPKVKCETTEIEDNIKLAKELGIEGTPAVIFPDGRLLRGYVPAEVFIDLLDKSEEKK